VTQKHTKRLTREQRQDFYRSIYLGMGDSRSVRAVKAFCDEHMKSKAPSLPTLTKYATDFGWVAEANRFDAERGSREYTDDAWHAALDMDGRHVKLGQAMQVRAAEALRLLDPRSMKDSSIAGMAERGVKIERLAAGAVTERVEITILSINGVFEQAMREFSGLVDRLERLDEPDRRWARSQFAAAIEDISYRFLAQQGITAPPSQRPVIDGDAAG